MIKMGGSGHDRKHEIEPCSTDFRKGDQKNWKFCCALITPSTTSTERYITKVVIEVWF